MRFFFAVMITLLLATTVPAAAQPRDEATDATPVEGAVTAPTPATVEEPKAPAPEPAAEKPAEPKPAKKPATPVKEKAKEAPKKKTAEKKPAPQKEPEARKQPPAAPVAAKEPVVVINPCTGEVTEEMMGTNELKAKSIRPGKKLECLSSRQCDALCRTGEAFGEGGGAPRLMGDGGIVFATDAYTSLDSCISACGPKCD